MLSKCKLEAGLLCATLTQHWHSTVRLAGWVGTVESEVLGECHQLLYVLNHPRH